jgi:tRNA modification GTPase
VLTTQSKLPDPEDTIVALASAAGPAARAIVRLSGRRAPEIAGSLCADLALVELQPGHFFSGQLRVPGLQLPVPADIYRFVVPRSYTGQDMIELHTIGCQPIVEVLLAACLNGGARAAQAGEFTQRAFLAGKLDLTRAEAVLGVIEAGERHELKRALKQLAGGLARPMQELREDLLNLLADVEAGLDFADEDIHFVSTAQLLKRLAKGLAYLTLMHKQIEQRGLGQRPYRVMLAGPPNAGKSSLFNALAGAAAALVSAEPGTTRDYLEATIEVDGIPVQLVDTAGLQPAGDTIDAQAQTLGQEQSHFADLILWCNPSGADTDCPFPSSQECWRIATKADLASPPTGLPATSVVTGYGLDELRTRLAQQVRQSRHSPLAPSSSRCRHHIDVCLQHLRNAHAIVLNEEMPELLALELRLALDELGAMSGAVFTDDLLERIFQRFCIGK